MSQAVSSGGSFLGAAKEHSLAKWYQSNLPWLRNVCVVLVLVHYAALHCLVSTALVRGAPILSGYTMVQIFRISLVKLNHIIGFFRGFF